MSILSDLEQRRQRALDALDLMDAPPEAAMDALAGLAAQLLGCPVGLVTLVDAERVWMTGRSGFAGTGGGRRKDVFCGATVEGDGPLIVPDAVADPRFAAMGAVTEMGMRAYAGTPIAARDPQSGECVNVGSVCALDTHARPFDHQQTDALANLAMVAEALLEARTLKTVAERNTDALTRADRTFRQAERMAAIGSWRLELADEALHWSEGVSRIHELPVGELPPLAEALNFYPPSERAIVSAKLAGTIETGTPFDFEVDFVTALGKLRRVRSIGELELRDGEPHALVGVFQDITDQHLVAEDLRRSATRDALTGIANRAAFNTAMDGAIARGTPTVLLFVDLDHFKQINDTHGHLVGDEVLRAFARRLSRVEGGFAARMGGDEFALVLTGARAEDAAAVAADLVDDLRRPVRTEAGPIAVSGTIGHAGWEAGMSLRELAHRADTALYAAKRRERGSVMAWGGLRSGDRRAA